MSKTLTIRGKEVSEDTIVEALQKHIGFEKEKFYPIITSCYLSRTKRVVINLPLYVINRIKSRNIIQVSLDEKGSLCDFSDNYTIPSMYENRKHIFGTIKE